MKSLLQRGRGSGRETALADRYAIGEKLDGGDGARVYLAEEGGAAREEAIKAMRPSRHELLGATVPHHRPPKRNALKAVLAEQRRRPFVVIHAFWAGPSGALAVAVPRRERNLHSSDGERGGRGGEGIAPRRARSQRGKPRRSFPHSVGEKGSARRAFPICLKASPSWRSP